MANSHNGMMEDHPRAGKAHDLPDPFPHVCFVAMHLAVGAEGLGLHEGTLVAAEPCISVQRGTFGAEFPAAMVFSAVDGDHQRNGLFFPFPLCFHIQFHLPSGSLVSNS